MKKYLKTILIWVVFFGIGSGIGIMLKNKLGQPMPVETHSSLRLDMIIAFPAFAIMLALLPMGYFLGRRMTNDI